MKFTNTPFVKLKDYFKREKGIALAEAEEHRRARANAKKKNSDNDTAGLDVVACGNE
jgi:hypothetical protein